MPLKAAKKSKRPRKVLKEINYLSDSDESMFSGSEDEPIKGRNSMEKAALSKRFQKKDMVEHILLRADVYIGSPDKTEEKVWVFNTNKDCMELKTIEYSPGLYKIFDEILVNAADNKQRDPSMKSIKVNIDKDSGIISVQNDGKGIPVEIHQEHNVYIPELIFGHLLTGENFEDTKKRIVGGKNGYGAKLTNIFSNWFEIETVDSKAGLKYSQRWTCNMTKKGAPKITKCAKHAKDYTKVSFNPDFKRFQSDNLEQDTYDLFCKRVYDIAGVTHLSLKVHLNGKKLKVDRFKNYVDMYISALNSKGKASSSVDSLSEKGDVSSEEEKIEDKFVKIYEKVNDFWEICITQSTGSFGHLSFVNSICTYKGGKHVDYICDLAVKKLAAKLNSDKEMKKANIKNSAIKNNLFIFVNSLIVNPTFNSQSKEYLATSSSKFGDKANLPKLSGKTEKALCNSDILSSIKASVNAQNLRKINRKTKGKRTGPLNIDKLEDAKNAGTKKWRQCTLLLTEGDSAKTTAISGLSVIGRDNYGVFPLKGKLLNVRVATNSQITKNKEIENICKIVGLAVGDKVDPQIFNKSSGSRKRGLRYGHIMVMTDQDHDGSHIKGLLFNFIHHYWPELLKEVPNFLQVFITPIVKCFPKSGKKDTLSFYTIPDYEKWSVENQNSLSRYIIKYYKGLGTSSKKEAKEYFKNIKYHKIFMKWDKEPNMSGEAIELAFSKKKAEDRKLWLTEYNTKYGAGDCPDGHVDFSVKKMTYSTFVNKELVHFSLADNIRSIPSAVDGLKPSQRKVLHGAIKKFLSRAAYSKQTMKVASLCGYVSGLTAYHHGEQSMQGTIVSMAQDFVGSNNINFLVPDGQFGSRLAGGKDASQARYISTGVTRILTKIFRKEDEGILNHLQEEGKIIEPEYFLPILPTVLVNGAQGIGTGWSTDIAMHNPRDIVKWLLRRMKRDEGESAGEIVPLHPWYRGFKGCIEKTKSTQYKSRAIYSLEEDSYTDEYYLKIKELPIYKWTNDYKKFLADMQEKEVQINSEDPRIKNIINDSSDDDVNFTVSLSKQFYDQLLKDEKLLIKTFMLEKGVKGTSNMHLFDYKHRIRKYDSQHDILEEFYHFRKGKYTERKEHIISVMEANKLRVQNEQRFVYEVATGEISITRRRKIDLEKELEEKGYTKLSDKTRGKTDTGVEDSDDEEDTTAMSYGYLLKIPILSLTMEKVEKLKKKFEDLCQELEAYREMKELDIWRTELEEFIEEYENYLVDTGCASVEQETRVPIELKRTVHAVARPSMLPEGEMINDLSSNMKMKCEVTPKPARTKKKILSADGPASKKRKTDKNVKKKKNLRVIDSDLSDVSFSDVDSSDDNIESENPVTRKKRDTKPVKAKVQDIVSLVDSSADDMSVEESENNTSTKTKVTKRAKKQKTSAAKFATTTSKKSKIKKRSSTETSSNLSEFTAEISDLDDSNVKAEENLSLSRRVRSSRSKSKPVYQFSDDSDDESEEGSEASFSEASESSFSD